MLQDKDNIKMFYHLDQFVCLVTCSPECVQNKGGRRNIHEACVYLVLYAPDVTLQRCLPTK